jgi:hypothetical protein
MWESRLCAWGCLYRMFYLEEYRVGSDQRPPMGVITASQNEQRSFLCPREEGVSRHGRENSRFRHASKLILLSLGTQGSTGFSS